MGVLFRGQTAVGPNTVLSYGFLWLTVIAIGLKIWSSPRESEHLRRERLGACNVGGLGSGAWYFSFGQLG